MTRQAPHTRIRRADEPNARTIEAPLPLTERATQIMPGGVSSPVRALQAVGGTPPVIVRGQGAQVWDDSGQRLVDLQMAFGPLIVGHAHPEVVQAVQETAAAGLHFATLHPHEVTLAARVKELHPAVDRLRFVSSGTEAVMSAIRLARAATGRDLVVKFTGGYHGHADALLSKAGSGLATQGLADSAGTTAGAAADTITLPLDDDAALDSFFAAHGDRVACALVEGIPANHGLLPQRRAWHERLRNRTRECGALLVVDEVITGFRIAPGGATEALGVQPDLVTLGKVLGGGMPIGAYGGRADLMALIAPEGPVYQAGTLSGSPVCLAAGIATLSALFAQPNAHLVLERTAQRFAGALFDHIEDQDARWSVAQAGSLVWMAPARNLPPHSATTLDQNARDRYTALYHDMRRREVLLPPSPYELAFLSTAHDDTVLDAVADRFHDSLRSITA